MEVPDTNQVGIVQSVTPSMPVKLNSTCVLVLLFIFNNIGLHLGRGCSPIAKAVMILFWYSSGTCMTIFVSDSEILKFPSLFANDYCHARFGIVTVLV